MFYNLLWAAVIVISKHRNPHTGMDLLCTNAIIEYLMKMPDPDQSQGQSEEDQQQGQPEEKMPDQFKGNEKIISIKLMLLLFNFFFLSVKD